MENLCKMTWEEMVERYPNKWVAVTNYLKDGPDLIEGELLAVLDDREIDDFRIKNWGKNYYYGRTTEERGIGIVHAKNFKLKNIQISKNRTDRKLSRNG